MAKLMQVVHKVQQRLNSDLSIAGVLITQYDGRKNLNKSVSELVQETFQGKVFSTHIRNAITLAEGLSFYHVTGEQGGTAGAPSCLIAFNKENTAVLETCGIDGKLVKPRLQ